MDTRAAIKIHYEKKHWIKSNGLDPQKIIYRGDFVNRDYFDDIKNRSHIKVYLKKTKKSFLGNHTTKFRFFSHSTSDYFWLTPRSVNSLKQKIYDDDFQS